MAVKKYFKADIPEGYRIYQKEFDIAGIQYRKSELDKLMKKGVDVSFSISAETNNLKDPNAVQVRGVRKGFFGKVDLPIGYVPAEIASHISDSKMVSVLIVRPKRMYISDAGFVEFTIDIIGPRDQFQRYKEV